VRVVPFLIVITSLCLGLVGCVNQNRRQGGDGNGIFLGSGPAAKGKRTETDPIMTTGGTNPDLEGILAGTVIDGASNRPIAAKIRWVCLDDPKEESSYKVETNPQGHYIIQGLKPGRRYKLVAEAKQDGRNLIGVKYTLAPNPLASIKLQEDDSKPDSGGAPPPTPPGGKAPEKPAEGASKKTTTISSPDRPASAQAPGWEPSGSLPVPPPPGAPGVGMGKPTPLSPQDGPAAKGSPPWGTPAPSVPVKPDQIVVPGGIPRPPRIEIPGPGASNQKPVLPGDPTPVPSCALIGGQLFNFALRDLSGQPWEYRKNKRGKLVLLDFWSTGCVPCLQGLPELRKLKERYGAHGLEVVGIAYENGGSPQDQARRVAATAAKYRIDYTLLLGSGRQCPVQTQFRIGQYPTLVLVNDYGWMPWRKDAPVGTQDLAELERAIRRGLGLPE
jgi:thiol-disulfide isomerase/thioredoxin